MDDVILLVAGIISIIMIITFFIMASRLKSIESLLDTLTQLELKKPENKKTVKCGNCGKEFFISILKKGSYTCPDCKNTIQIK
jgi:DNA-directed RNA polymerase subunit RPC12/RpoP